MRRGSIVCVLLLTVSCQAFLPSIQISRTQHAPKSLYASTQRQKGEIATCRRALLTGLSSLLAVVTLPYSAQAATGDALFKANPLTNSVLEQIRIWEQAEADNLKYGGELERGDAGNRGQTGAYPRLLVPILQMAYDLETVNAAVQQRSRYPDAVAILNKPSYNKIAFKKIFNQFSDNIYYSDPDRANLYLGGGATPKTEQSLAYLLRNEILTNVEDLQAELDYLMEHPEESDDTDLKSFAAAANVAMQRYLKVVPPNELKQAKELMQ